MPKKRTGLVSLAYSDSENEDDSLDEEELQESDDSLDQEKKELLITTEINSDKDNTNDKEKEIFFEDVYGDIDVSIQEFHQSLYGKSFEEIQIPFPTKQKCPDDLQRRIEVYFEKVKMGSDLNKSIQKRKDLRNPSIYEKMISYCQIDEMATNYPKQIYDPKPFLGLLSYYEELSRLQKEEVEKRERERKDASKNEATSSKRLAIQGGSGNEKKTKWDSAPKASNVSSNTAALAAAISKAQNLVHVNKPTVISAFGTINKKK